jgi:hypothetical protein
MRSFFYFGCTRNKMPMKLKQIKGNPAFRITHINRMNNREELGSDSEYWRVKYLALDTELFAIIPFECPGSTARKPSAGGGVLQQRAQKYSGRRP